MLLDLMLRRLIVIGRLRLVLPDGSERTYQGGPGPEAALRIKDRATMLRLGLRPALHLGEAWMDGRIEAVDCSLYDLLDLLIRNREAAPPGRLSAWLGRPGIWLRRLAQHNPVGLAQRHAAHHYDLSGRLYSLFLDRDRQYSCAYFLRPDDGIEQAQAQKKRHVAAKLCLDRPDLEVLDIGCGWGGLALTLARDYGARVTGITLSTEQQKVASDRAAAAGLAGRVRFSLCDYREVEGQFDRIVSVGMFEHVGVGYYPAFFGACARVLRPDGIALLHSIGRSDGPGATNAWLRKYIFPGSYAPALSETLAAVEQARLIATDVEVLRLHYAETLKHWHARFRRNRDAIAALYDERFCRMWEFYLVASELAFRRQAHMVFQLQFARRQEAVPLTRDYIAEAERAAAARRAALPVAPQVAGVEVQAAE